VCASGISTLIVDRNYQMVLAHTDRCAVMEKGRIVLADSSSALMREPEQLARYLGV
jgi:branched-chain amino acid transport system ATP-binding protein